MAVNRFRRSNSVDDSLQHMRCDDGRVMLTTAVVVGCQIEQEVALIVVRVLYLIPEYLHKGGSGEDLNWETEAAMPTS